DFIWTGGDCHLYSNHFEQAELQLAREPRPYPTLTIKRKPASLFDYEFEDFEITGYEPHPHIKAPVAVCLRFPPSAWTSPPRPPARPSLTYRRKAARLFYYELQDSEITGYKPHPHIKPPVAV